MICYMQSLHCNIGFHRWNLTKVSAPELQGDVRSCSCHQASTIPGSLSKEDRTARPFQRLVTCYDT
ncbi:hypothetical protein ACFPU1_05480 [Thalassorhabdus alkalitolerans]|uniref:Uncharacterized protein n=1 Tax=Thalassorhabdus alkalitolerans TaxID=2282697 RepID=A0ABW0YIS3_9BACI